MTDGPYHSIGEVLSLLKEEHEDLTISKIRFLESQGLIEPERTPSGYRRFYDTDIDRLRCDPVRPGRGTQGPGQGAQGRGVFAKTY